MSEIVPATQTLLEQATGRPLQKSARAIAVVDGERLLGVAGIYRDRDRTVMFANPLEPMREHKRILVRACRIVMHWAKERGLPIHAQANPTLAGSCVLLEHLGFRRVPHMDLWIHRG